MAPKAKRKGTAKAGVTIGVLCGGPSAEREVSLKSGAAVASALERAGLKVRRLEIDEETVAQEVRRGDLDVAFLALHGEFGEDGQIQRILDNAGLPYTGSGPNASAEAMDKWAAKRKFVKAGVPTPAAILLSRPCPWAEVPSSDLNLPVVVKPVNAGSSIGVTIVREREAFEPALVAALKFSPSALVERFVEGREFTVGIIEDEDGSLQALPPVEVVAGREFYDYTAKYSDAGTRYICPARIPDESVARLKELALAAHRTLGCRDMSRTDMITDRQGEPWVLEVNTIPGFTDHSLLPKAAAAAGVGFEELCVRLVHLALARRLRERR